MLREKRRGKNDVRPDMNTTLLLVADDTLAKLDDASPFQLLHGLDWTYDQRIVISYVTLVLLTINGWRSVREGALYGGESV